MVATMMALGGPVRHDAGEAGDPPFTVTEQEIKLPGLTINRAMGEGAFVLAVTGFLDFAGGKKANRQSFRFEEIKLPDIGE